MRDNKTYIFIIAEESVKNIIESIASSLIGIESDEFEKQVTLMEQYIKTQIHFKLGIEQKNIDESNELMSVYGINEDVSKLIQIVEFVIHKHMEQELTLTALHTIEINLCVSHYPMQYLFCKIQKESS